MSLVLPSALAFFLARFLQALQLEVLPVVVAFVLANSSRSLKTPHTVQILPFSLTSVLLLSLSRVIGLIAFSLGYQYLITRPMNTEYLHFSHS